MRRLTATLLVAASLTAAGATTAAHACDPELGNCTLQCLRHAHLVVDPRDPGATLDGLVPACPTA